jgi:radical SAM protein with 4Fe4S-binding SPASM domain
VYVCPDFAGQGLFPLGSIHDDSPLSLNGPHRAFFDREEALSLSCCDDWHICRGGCFASAYYNTGNALSSDPYCGAYKEIFSFARSLEGESAA